MNNYKYNWQLFFIDSGLTNNILYQNAIIINSIKLIIKYMHIENIQFKTISSPLETQSSFKQDLSGSNTIFGHRDINIIAGDTQIPV